MSFTIDELLVGLRLDIDKQSFNNASSSFAGVTQAARRMAGVLGVGLGMDKLTRQFAGTNAELGRFSRNANASVQYVSGLEHAFRQSGSGADEARASIGSVLDMWKEFQVGDMGRFNAAAMLGFDTSSLLQAKSLEEVITNISTQTSKMSATQRRGVLEALGIGGQGAQTLFSQGPNALNSYLEQAKELAPVTRDMIDASIDFEHRMNELSLALKGITDQLSMEILPDLTDALGDATRFIRENNKLISEYLGKDQFEIGGDIGDRILDGISTWATDHGMSEQDAQNLREGGLSGYLQGRDTSYDQLDDYNVEQWFDEQEKQRKKAEAGLLNDDTIGAWLNSQSSNDPIGENILNAIGWQESRNRHRDANGNLITSHAGARGQYQIMPATGRQPGMGVSPLRNDTAEEHKRFADDYLTALYKKFGGDLDATFAAYNAGAGTVQNLQKQYGSDWLKHAPAETRAYVPSVKGKLSQLEGGRPQASVSVGQITVQGATDPMETARLVRREITVMAEQAGADMSTGVV